MAGQAALVFVDKMNEIELSEESLRGISSLQEESDFWSKVSDSAEDKDARNTSGTLHPYAAHVVPER